MSRSIPKWLENIVTNDYSVPDSRRIVRDLSRFDRDPLATDALGQGFKSGYIWINDNTKEAFLCVESTIGNAIWKKLTSHSEVEVTDRNPLSSDNLSRGFGVGTIWINSIERSAFIAVISNSVTAVWKPITEGTNNTGSGTNLVKVIDRYPNAVDYDYNLLSFWICNIDNTIWILANKEGGLATWIEVSNQIIDGGEI